MRRRKFLYFLSSFVFSLLALYFGVSLIIGERGLFVLRTLKADIEHNKVLLRVISMQRAQLSNKVLGLYEKSLDLDLLDEQVKNSLGYTRVDELVVVLDVSS